MTIISGSVATFWKSGSMIGMAEPAIAPMVNWPSAPMFQLLERYPTASPTAIRMSGVALTTSSSRDQPSVSGSMK